MTSTLASEVAANVGGLAPGMTLATVPALDTAEDERGYRKRELAAACRVFGLPRTLTNVEVNRCLT